MDLGLEGKTAIVTEGSAGIGLACAKTLFSEGVSVAISADLTKSEGVSRVSRPMRSRPWLH